MTARVEPPIIFRLTQNVQDLTPVEALALLNCWAKINSDFFSEDLDVLYKLKEQKIIEFLRPGELKPTQAIVRDSPAIAVNFTKSWEYPIELAIAP